MPHAPSSTDLLRPGPRSGAGITPPSVLPGEAWRVVDIYSTIAISLTKVSLFTFAIVV